MFVIQKSVADMIMKSRDLSKLQKVKVTDKNGKTRTVYKRTGEQPSEVKQKKPAEEKPVDTKKYSDMLDKVKNGPEENALSVNGKMLNKKDAMNYLSEKVGKKSPKNWADAEDDAYAKGQKKAREKYGDMSIEELEDVIKEKTSHGKYSDEYREAIDINDILQEKKKEAASKGTESVYSNWSRDDKIKTLVNYQHMMYKDVSMDKWRELYNKDSDEEINAEFDKFAKVKNPETYLNKYDKDGNPSKKKTESKPSESDESSESVDKITEYRNQLKDVAKKDPVAYMKFMDQANKDFQNYKNLAEKADLVSRAPYFANIPEYAGAKKEMQKLEEKYPDFKEMNDRHMAYYKFD